MYYIVYEALTIDSNESVYSVQCIHYTVYSIHCTLYTKPV